MFYTRFVKPIVSLSLAIVLTLVGIVPGIGEPRPAYAADVVSRESPTEITSVNSSIDWAEVDEDLVKGLGEAHYSAEKFVTKELDYWINNLMKKVDEDFFTWYFSYFNQKAMEFGAPFAWLFFAGDYSLNVFRSEEDKNLKPGEVYQQRMIGDFEREFSQRVVSPEEMQEWIKQLAERVGYNYTSAVAIKFAQTKNYYNIPDRDWQRYLNDIATVTYGTGNINSSLDPENFTSKNLGLSILAGGVSVGSKLAINVAAKASAKMLGKAAGAVAAKVGAKLLDPALGIGILIWDIWDYNSMVEKTRPELRQNILDYFNELEWSILKAPDESIMAAIEEAEGNIVAGVESRRAYQDS